MARNIISFLRTPEANAERLAQCRVAGTRALDIMERQLAGHDWLTDHGPTVADISLVAYTQAADEGGFELANWPGISRWIDRCLALPGVVPLERAA